MWRPANQTDTLSRMVMLNDDRWLDRNETKEIDSAYISPSVAGITKALSDVCQLAGGNPLRSASISKSYQQAAQKLSCWKMAELVYQLMIDLDADTVTYPSNPKPYGLNLTNGRRSSRLSVSRSRPVATVDKHYRPPPPI